MKNIVNIIKEEVSNIVNEATETNVIWDTMKTPQWNEMLTKIKEEYNIDILNYIFPKIDEILRFPHLLLNIILKTKHNKIEIINNQISCQNSNT